MASASGRLLGLLVAVDVGGAVIAKRCRIAGEPLGVGASLDVRKPAVLVFWGSGLSAPLASLGLAAVLHRRRSRLVRPVAALFAVGALSEPVCWGRRPCPRLGRALLVAHIVLAAALAANLDRQGSGPPPDVARPKATSSGC